MLRRERSLLRKHWSGYGLVVLMFSILTAGAQTPQQQPTVTGNSTGQFTIKVQTQLVIETFT